MVHTDSNNSENTNGSEKIGNILNRTIVAVGILGDSGRHDHSKMVLVGDMESVMAMMSIIFIIRTTCGVIPTRVRGVEVCG